MEASAAVRNTQYAVDALAASGNFVYAASSALTGELWLGRVVARDEVAGGVEGCDCLRCGARVGV